jgi:Holliday junction DNA helicase RuvA
MIAQLSGTLIAKLPTEVVVDVRGVGYAAAIPLSTYSTIGEIGTAVVLLTHLHVREDALQLYGFSTEEEREAFRLLVSVNGIGPRMALAILSGIPPSDLRTYISGGNASALTAVPGVGKKIAERLILELRDKIGRTGSTAEVWVPGSEGQRQARAEALAALLSLGFQRPAAEKALKDALLESPDAGLTVEALIKAALRRSARQS